MSKGRSLIIKVPLRDIVLSRCRQYYTLDIIDGLRRVSDEVSSTFQGSPGLDGMKVSDPRDDPVFNIRLPFSFSDTLYFRSRCLSSRLAVSEIHSQSGLKMDRVEKKTRARFTSSFGFPHDESELPKSRPSCFFVLSGRAGRARNEGRKGRPGIACKS